MCTSACRYRTAERLTRGEDRLTSISSLRAAYLYLPFSTEKTLGGASDMLQCVPSKRFLMVQMVHVLIIRCSTAPYILCFELAHCYAITCHLSRIPYRAIGDTDSADHQLSPYCSLAVAWVVRDMAR